MQEEPREIRLAAPRAARSRRLEVVRSARQRVASAAGKTFVDAAPIVAPISAVEEAFADMSEPPPPSLEAKESAPKSEAWGAEILTQLNDQMRQLDEQREQLAALLERARQ